MCVTPLPTYLFSFARRSAFITWLARSLSRSHFTLLYSFLFMYTVNCAHGMNASIFILLFWGGIHYSFFSCSLLLLVLLLLLMVVLTRSFARSFVRSFVCWFVCLKAFAMLCTLNSYYSQWEHYVCAWPTHSCMYMQNTSLSKLYASERLFSLRWVCVCVCMCWTMEWTPFTSFHIVCFVCVSDFVIVFLSSFSGKWMCFILAVFVLSTNNLYENFCENFVNSYVNDKVFWKRNCVCASVWYVVCWKSSCKIKYAIKQARTTIMSATNLQKHFRPTQNEQWSSEMQQQPHQI